MALPSRTSRDSVCIRGFPGGGADLYHVFLKLRDKYGSLLEDYQPGATNDDDIEEFIRKTDREAPGFRSLEHWDPMGDEIGPAVDATSVNTVPSQRLAFHDYLRQASDGAPSFFGVSTYDALDFAADARADMTRCERRLYYHSAVFRWLATAQYYGRMTSVIRRVYPNARTMANYSPYTVFYYGAGMDHGQNSFALPRANACTGHWGEDWLPPSGVSSLAGFRRRASSRLS